MQLCYISAYILPVMQIVSKLESCIFLKKKRPNNGRCCKSTTHCDFFIVQNTVRTKVLAFSVVQCEMGFIGPQCQTINHHLQPFFELPTPQIFSASQNRWATVYDDGEFCTDSIGGYAIVLPKQ